VATAVAANAANQEPTASPSTWMSGASAGGRLVVRWPSRITPTTATAAVSTASACAAQRALARAAPHRGAEAARTRRR